MDEEGDWPDEGSYEFLLNPEKNCYGLPDEDLLQVVTPKREEPRRRPAKCPRRSQIPCPMTGCEFTAWTKRQVDIHSLEHQCETCGTSALDLDGHKCVQRGRGVAGLSQDSAHLFERKQLNEG